MGSHSLGASQVALVVKNMPAGDPGLIPDQEDPLEKEMETHSCILAWRIPWTEEPGRLQSMGPQRVGHYRSDLACTHGALADSSPDLLKGGWNI